MCCSNVGSEMGFFFKSTNRNAGSLEELLFWRWACKLPLSLLKDGLLLLRVVALVLLLLLLLFVLTALVLLCASGGLLL
jgi:hypothetical protein